MRPMPRYLSNCTIFAVLCFPHYARSFHGTIGAAVNPSSINSFAGDSVRIITCTETTAGN
jgi:hypothetical protein